MNILSIQSSVVRGHVGNSAAVPALNALGHDVWAIDTVTFSNHPGHGGFRGRVTDATLMSELVRGLQENGDGLQNCAAVLSGYLGGLDQGPTMLDAVAAVRAANPRALFALDPVIGDGGRIYVKPGIADFLRDRAIPQADIALPNGFELELLTGIRCDDTASARSAIDRLRARMDGSMREGAALVVATGLRLRDQSSGTMAILGADDCGAWRLSHPAVAHPASGAGDLFAALLLGRLLNGETASEAAAGAATAVYDVICDTASAALKDLRLVAARDRLARIEPKFEAERLR